MRLSEEVKAGGATDTTPPTRGWLFARERIDARRQGSSSDGMYARQAEARTADGVVTGTATIDGRPVC